MPPVIPDAPIIEVALDDDVTFEDMLRQYQELNRRLETAAYRLQTANAPLCPRTETSAGYTVHTVRDYPEMLQPAARELLSVSENVSIRTVREGSPAQAAGLRSDDLIIRINKSYLPGGRTAQTFYEAVSAKAMKAKRFDLEVRRGETLIKTDITPEIICAYGVNPFFSEQINGHTDGEEIWITSELIRSTPRDIDLALVIAHEMAHAIGDHLSKPPSKLLELEADRMALIMLARAGYDIADVAENWAGTPYPHMNGDTETHPAFEERLRGARETISAITKARNSGRALTFDIK